MTEKLRQFILFCGDVALLYLSLFLALNIRNQAIIGTQIWTSHWPVFSYVFAVWLIAFYIAGMYAIANIRNDLKFYVNVIRVMSVNILLAITVFYILPQTQLTPKTILVLTGIIYFALFFGWRQLAHNSILKRTLRQRVLITGKNETVRELVKLLDRSPQYGYDLAAIMAHNAHDEIGNVPDYQDPAQLTKTLHKHRISLIVMDRESRDSKKLINNLYQHLHQRLEFLTLDEFYEMVTKRVPLDIIDQFWFLENLQEGKKQLYDFSKRMVDIAVAIIFGIIALVLAPIISMLILITSGAPVFYLQARVGKNGNLFQALKFRTMVHDPDKNNEQPTVHNDPRITPFGNILRKTRLDELPQLLNILRGEMSFVGPRPERPELVETLEREIPFYRTRLLVKPGLTGWDQISGEYHSPSVEDSMKKLQYDLYYIKNRSLVLDLSIILRTIKTVLSGMGR